MLGRRVSLAMQFNFVVSTNERAVRLWQSHGFDCWPDPGAHAISPSSTALSTRRCSAIHVAKARKTAEGVSVSGNQFSRTCLDANERTKAVNLRFVNELVGVKCFGVGVKAAWDASCVETRQKLYRCRNIPAVIVVYSARFSSFSTASVNCQPCVRPRADTQ